MTISRLCARFRPVSLLLALLVVTLISVACAPTTPAGSGATAAATQAAQPAPATAAPTAARAPTATVGRLSDLPVGVDAAGNFYRGDPNAAVKLVEWSDFQ